MAPKRKISIDEWMLLCKEGANIACEIYLNGVSMQPLIKKNRDLVTVIPLRRELMVGDIIVFRDKAGRNVCHRVYKIDGDTITTWGDNCINPDRPITKADVIALVQKMKTPDGKVTILDSEKSRKYGVRWWKIRPIFNFYKRCRSFAAHCFRKVFPRR